MLHRRCLAVLAVAFFLLMASASACGGVLIEPSDGGLDSSADVRSSDVAMDTRSRDSGRDSPGDVGVELAPELVDLRVTTTASAEASPPVTLVPRFSPSVHDYYVRCASGTNALTVSMQASPGAESSLLQPTMSPKLPKQTLSLPGVHENQAIVAAATAGSTTVEYWVRCLPYDFPDIHLDPHPEAGVPPTGYYLIGNFIVARGGYAMVLDGDGVPVWYYLKSNAGVSDVDGVVDGAVSFTSNSGGPFEVHAITDPPTETTVSATAVSNDEHELQVLANGDYLVISAPTLEGVDLTGLPPIRQSDGGSYVPGPGSTIKDCYIVEFEPTTGAVQWTWKASEHFDPAEDSIEPLLGAHLTDGGFVIDTFHCNAIDIDPANENLLISARQMNSIFYVERPSGTVVWKMGGAEASIDVATYIPVADPFYQQHDARLQPGWSTCTGGQISLYDDESLRMGPARAVLYDVVLGGGDGGCGGGTPSATVAWQYAGKQTSVAGGSFRISADGSRVIGWGLQPNYVFTEVDEKGNDLLDLLSPVSGSMFPMQSYRSIKMPLTAFDLDVMRATAGL
jgi:hypothetical protein